MTLTKIKRIAATAALGALVLTGAVAGGASAAGDAAPYEKVCVGLINGAKINPTPQEAADLWFGGDVAAYQEMQRTCKDGGLG